MERINKNNLMQISIAVVLIIVIIAGVYSTNQIKKDYESKILGLTIIFEKSFEEQNKEIEGLKSKLASTNKDVEESKKQQELSIGELSQKIGDLEVESESFSSVISDKIDAVVSVLTNTGQGSGAIISSEGYVITNYHVIENVKQANIKTYDGEKYNVILVGVDKDEDLALLKIVSNDTFDYFEFGNSDNLKAGQKVVALGNPAGLSFTATEGIISSPSRLINGNYFIQTDVTINPGNSGGPLINSLGEIVGIVNFKISNFEELGFAIPGNKVEDFIDGFI